MCLHYNAIDTQAAEKNPSAGHKLGRLELMPMSMLKSLYLFNFSASFNLQPERLVLFGFSLKLAASAGRRPLGRRIAGSAGARTKSRSPN